MGFYEEKLVPVIRAVCAVIEQTEHMQDILHGTMSEERFRFQILQNHQYLLDYTRCWAVAFSKCTCFQEMEDWYPIVKNTMEGTVMEIMGFLQEKGLKGEILHGTPEAIARRLNVLKRVAEAREKLSHMKLGCFGEPGGLIASDVDFDKLKALSGMECRMFDLEEVVGEFHKGGYPENAYTKELKTRGFDPQEVDKALQVYGALKRLIARYDLTGVTVKCFDLLGRIHTTGCLALALLNAEGIPAACEGDQKSLVSMAVLEALTGQAGFMANPSCMDPEKSEIIFAHCTLPINMPDSYHLVTHFESGIGVAVSGDLAEQPVTIFKCDDSMERYYAGRAELLETMHRPDLCRTQMRLKLQDGTGYFSGHPISNHHMIIKGDWKEVIDEFFRG